MVKFKLILGTIHNFQQYKVYSFCLPPPPYPKVYYENVADTLISCVPLCIHLVLVELTAFTSFLFGFVVSIEM